MGARNVIGFGLALSLLGGAGSAAAPVLAQGEPSGPIRVLRNEVVNEFPDGFRFILAAECDAALSGVRLNIKVLGRDVSIFFYPTFEPGTSIEATLFADASGRGGRESIGYQPPGTELQFSYTIEDVAGNVLETPPRGVSLRDERFEWTEIEHGELRIHYYGPVRRRAEGVLAAMQETLEVMGPVLGATLSAPVGIWMYNNVRDMGAALPFVSQTTQSGLITEGQASFDQRVILILADDPHIRGIASHELTHILLHEVVSPYDNRLPPWVHEGVAEYGNLEPAETYETYLAVAILRDRLLPLREISGQSFRPGNPDDVIAWYGQSRSLVRFLAETYGAEQFRQFLAAFKLRPSLEGALSSVYGLDLDGLDNAWRLSVGADPVTPATRERGASTPPSQPTMVPFGAPTQVALLPTPTRVRAQATATPAASSAADEAGARRGTSCQRSPHAAAGSLDGGWLAVLVGPVVALGWRRRQR